MDVQAYIASGILEAYALGQASSQEQQEVSCLSKIYPEIAAHLKIVEADMGSYVQQFNTTPPPALKQNILAAIADVEQEEPQQNSENKTAHKPVEAAQTKVNPKVISLQPETKTKKPAFNIGMAAAVVLAIALAAVLFVQTNNSAKAQKKLIELQQANIEKQQDLENISGKMDQLLAPEVNLVKMAGTEKYPSAFAAVYWNNQTGQVVLNSKKLAALPDSKQYQLWVLVDGQPVDMGLVPTQMHEDLLDMKTTTAGQHFAITIENKGGSVSPTLEEMVVFGTIPA